MDMIEMKKITEDIHIPTPPTADGVWDDERRDHVCFQKIVSLAAKLGGVNTSAGCLTQGAEEARLAGEQQYYRLQEIRPELISKNNK